MGDGGVVHFFDHGCVMNLLLLSGMIDVNNELVCLGNYGRKDLCKKGWMDMGWLQARKRETGRKDE